MRTLPAGFTSAPPGSPPPYHGCSRGAFPALRRIKWTLPRVSWEYTGAVDLCCLDGNHVAAAGDHGTEQVRLADGGDQVASRKQKGTERARFSPGTGRMRIKLLEANNWHFIAAKW